MSLLRESPFMRSSIVGRKLQNIDGVAGKLMITSTNGEMDTSDSLSINTTTDTVDVNAQKGLFVAEAAVVDSGECRSQEGESSLWRMENLSTGGPREPLQRWPMPNRLLPPSYRTPLLHTPLRKVPGHFHTFSVE